MTQECSVPHTFAPIWLICRWWPSSGRFCQMRWPLNSNFIVTDSTSSRFLSNLACCTLLETWWTQFPSFSNLPFSLGFVFPYLSSEASSNSQSWECLACTYSWRDGPYFSSRFLSRRGHLLRWVNHPDIQFFVWHLYCLAQFEHLFGCSRFRALILILSESDLEFVCWCRFAILFGGRLCSLACRLFVLSLFLSSWEFCHSFQTCSYFPLEHLLIWHKDLTYLRESLLLETGHQGFGCHSSLSLLSYKEMATGLTPHTTRIQPAFL